ncbi:MAG: ATP-dependent DNA helicase [Pseudomonadota bacterium]
MTDLRDFFGEDSPMIKHLPGFRPRPAQSWMAEAVAEAIDSADRLVVEAGTGTGKTFAYLVPALLSGKKTIISTGTKALQDQLYHRDLPLVGKAIGRPVSTALLKGRANYLCLHRLDQVDSVAPALRDDIMDISEWRHETRSGDIAELSYVPEESPVWPMVTSTSDNCLGQKCAFYNDCFVVKARRAAQEADLVVVNHYLLLADLAMKENGFVEFLPGAETVVVDEAHLLPDLATQFFGLAVGTREIERLVEDCRALTLADREMARALDVVLNDLRKLKADAPRAEGRYPLPDILHSIRAPLDALQDSLQSLLLASEANLGDSTEMDKAYEQLALLIERLVHIADSASLDGLRWMQVNPRSLRLNLTPLDVSDTLSGLLSNGFQSWILTSATLAVGEDFSHYLTRTGLHEARALHFPSPFPVAERGLVYLPIGLPQPSDREHTAKFMDSVCDLLEFTVGGAFFLFTSHRALREAERWFARHAKRLSGRPLLVQGDGPRDDLVRRFRDAGNAVLLGTGTFWEGVDVRGSALTLVAIDKLPFTSPSDPLLMARLEFLRREGGNGFMEHQVPQAVISLKQGAGRLLRDHDDYGVVALGDPRITGKRYGRIFLESLAPMPHTDSLNDVASFLARTERSVA